MFISPIEPSSHYECQIQAPAPISLGESLPVEAKPHLILHFDMNKTLIASDREGHKTASDVVCIEIAERVVDLWDDSLSEPISYADYVKYYLIPNPGHSLEIKAKQTAQMAKVLSVLEERNHPSFSRMEKMYNRVMGTLESHKSQVFQSFYRLIEFLQKEQVPFTLVIRTFGSEGAEIAEEINDHFGEDFLTDFRTIRRGAIEGTDSDLYDLISHSDHHLVIRDDWSWWSEHGLNWQYGKPFPVDLNDPGHISLFFDDNAKVDPLSPEENIVFPYNAATNEPISPGDLIDRGQLLPVEMLDAVCDEEYYIRFVKRALRGL